MVLGHVCELIARVPHAHHVHFFSKTSMRMYTDLCAREQTKDHEMNVNTERHKMVWCWDMRGKNGDQNGTKMPLNVISSVNMNIWLLV